MAFVRFVVKFHMEDGSAIFAHVAVTQHRRNGGAIDVDALDIGIAAAPTTLPNGVCFARGECLPKKKPSADFASITTIHQ